MTRPWPRSPQHWHSIQARRGRSQTRADILPRRPPVGAGAGRGASGRGSRAGTGRDLDHDRQRAAGRGAHTGGAPCLCPGGGPRAEQHHRARQPSVYPLLCRGHGRPSPVPGGPDLRARLEAAFPPAALPRQVRQGRLRVGYHSFEFFARSALDDYFPPVLESHDRRRIEIVLIADGGRQDRRTDELPRSRGPMGGYRRPGSGGKGGAAAPAGSRCRRLPDRISAGAAPGLRPARRAGSGRSHDDCVDDGDEGLRLPRHRPVARSARCYRKMERGEACPARAWVRPNAAAGRDCRNPRPFPHSPTVTSRSDRSTICPRSPPGTLALWSRVLTALPMSRLLLKARALEDAQVATRYLDLAAQAGINPRRIDIVGSVPDNVAHLKALALADIALDPVPFSGGRTTVETLAMGVPVVNLRSPMIMGRLELAAFARRSRASGRRHGRSVHRDGGSPGERSRRA